jgi:hypothetical protein
VEAEASDLRGGWAALTLKGRAGNGRAASTPVPVLAPRQLEAVVVHSSVIHCSIIVDAVDLRLGSHVSRGWHPSGGCGRAMSRWGKHGGVGAGELQVLL